MAKVVRAGPRSTAGRGPDLRRRLQQRRLRRASPTPCASTTRWAPSSSTAIYLREQARDVAAHPRGHARGQPHALPSRPDARTRIRSSASRSRENETIHERVLGRPMLKVLRPTYGAYGERVRRIATQLGYDRMVIWNVDTHDWKRGSIGPRHRAPRHRCTTRLDHPHALLARRHGEGAAQDHPPLPAARHRAGRPRRGPARRQGSPGGRRARCVRPSPDRLRNRVGAWRSLVAHLTGGQEVAGSNPVAPTTTASVNAEPSGAVQGAFRFRRVHRPAQHLAEGPRCATDTGPATEGPMHPSGGRRLRSDVTHDDRLTEWARTPQRETLRPSRLDPRSSVDGVW